MKDTGGFPNMIQTGHIAFMARAAFALAALHCCGALAANVSIQGQLEASDAVWLGRVTQTGERSTDVIAKIVPEGTQVEKGDFVFQLDTAPMERGVETAQAQVDQSNLTVKFVAAELDTLQGQLSAQEAKGSALLAPFTLEVERLEAPPDPVDLAAAEAQFKAAQASLDEAESKRKALERLTAQGMASRQALDTVRYDVETATADRDGAQATLDGVRAGADPFDLQIARLKEQKQRLQIQSDTDDLAAQAQGARITLESARSGAAWADRRLKTARGELALATRNAPVDGMVVYAEAREGGKVSQGSSIYHGFRIAAIISGKAFQFRGSATEAVLARMRPGLAASLHVDALPGTVLKGHVVSFDISLAQEENAQPGAAGLERPRPRTFEVIVALDQVPDGLMPGMSARADVQLGEESPAQDALSTEIARSWDGRADGPVPPLFGGYVEPVQRAPAFLTSDLAGYITYLAEPYAHLKAGDPILECTADKAEAKLTDAEAEPAFAEDLLDLARVNAEQAERQRQTQAQMAGLDVQIAQAGLDRLKAPPRDCDLRAVAAGVRGAQAALEKARQRLSIEQAAALASGATLDRLKLDVQLADIALQQAQLKSRALADGPPAEKLRLAELRVERARKQKDMLAEVAAAALKAGQASVHTYEVRLETANKRLGDARALYDNRVLRAPIAGNVVFNPDPGFGSGRLRLGDTIPVINIEAAYVADLSKLQFCAVLDQDGLSRVHVGQKAQVGLVALPGRILAGRVTSLMPLVMDREEVLSPEGYVPAYSGVRCSKAQITLDLPAELVGRILPDMTGTARLLPDEPAQAARPQKGAHGDG